MRTYKLYQIDSFTKDKLFGNPAGVVTNADGLSEHEMQQIAREMNNSETAFIFHSKQDAYDVEIRYFTPTREVPICGHATIAAHYARALENNFGTTRYLYKTGAGVLPIEIEKDKHDYKITMTQAAVEFGAFIEDNALQSLLAGLGVTSEDLLKDHKPQIVSTGHSKVMVGIRSKKQLDSLEPNHQILCELSKKINCNGYYVYTMSPDATDEVLVHGRMFAPAIGINEDPVTGNANGPLGAYLVQYRLVDHDGKCLRYQAMQGEAIGRTGIIEIEVLIEHEKPILVKISGNAVVVFQTELIL